MPRGWNNTGRTTDLMTNHNSNGKGSRDRTTHIDMAKTNRENIDWTEKVDAQRQCVRLTVQRGAGRTRTYYIRKELYKKEAQ